MCLIHVCLCPEQAQRKGKKVPPQKGGTQGQAGRQGMKSTSSPGHLACLPLPFRYRLAARVRTPGSRLPTGALGRGIRLGRE